MYTYNFPKTNSIKEYEKFLNEFGGIVLKNAQDLYQFKIFIINNAFKILKKYGGEIKAKEQQK
jgi:hypothetical protein